MLKWLKITFLITLSILFGRWCGTQIEDRLGINRAPQIQGEADDKLLALLQPESAEQLRTRLVLAEARRQGVPPDLALAVSRVENWGAIPTARSSAGAVGLMQVMPFWTDFVPLIQLCSGSSLITPEINVCFGVGILRIYKARYGTWPKALRAYNGSLRLPRAGARYVRLVNKSLNTNKEKYIG